MLGVKRRNPDYNKLLSVLFTRLAKLGSQINRVVLDSKKVINLPLEDRIAKLPFEYPIDLASVDIDEFRKTLQREIARMYRDPSASEKSHGNSQKRIQIFIDRSIHFEQLALGGNGVGTIDDIEEHTPGLKETERNYLRSARVGQGEFREKLITKFRSKCPVTGITEKRLLVASHIKPWKVCNNYERLDLHNGILLSALADKLFDQGLVTFQDNGDVVISPSLLIEDQERCGIKRWTTLNLSDRSKCYMEYHRNIEFYHN